MNPTLVGTYLALVNGTLLFITACVRKRRFDVADIGLAGVVFAASFNLCPPVVLIQFALDPVAYGSLPAELHGYEKYIALAAFLSFLFTLVSIVSAYAKAWKAN